MIMCEFECKRVCVYLYVCVCVCVRVSACGWFEILYAYACIFVRMYASLRKCVKECACVRGCASVCTCGRTRVREKE